MLTPLNKGSTDRRQASADERSNPWATGPVETARIVPMQNIASLRAAQLRRSRGFSLIELAVALLVVAILASIAVPAYNDSVRKSRRAEAFAALTAVQQAQERWRGGHTAYTTDTDDLGVSDTTPNGYYEISLGSPGESEDDLATGYTATATAVSGTSQSSDASCAKLSMKMQGGTLSYAGCGSCSTFTYTETHACWAR